MSTDYSDILLTIDGDIDLSSDDAVFISTNLDSLRQRLNIRYAIWQGEWKYNEFLGTPYREYIGKAFNKATIDAEIKRQALLEPDVERLDNFKSAFDRNIRLYSCSFDVETNEESISYGLVLRDSFEYVIPNYDTSCDKIIRYKYVTSKPYPILAQDYTNNQLSINNGIIKEPIKEAESTVSSVSISRGEMRNIVQFLNIYQEDNITYSTNLLGGEWKSATGNHSQHQEDNITYSTNMIGRTWTKVVIDHVQPQEDNLTYSADFVSGTWTKTV